MEKLGKLPEWDLSDLYTSQDSKEIDLDIEKAYTHSSNFLKKYKGHLADLSGESFYNSISEYENISEIIGKLISFAYLNYVLNVEDEKRSIFLQHIQEKINDISKNLVFFSLEINSLSDENIAKKLESDNTYASYIENIRRYKKHQLSEELEQFIIEKSATSNSAFVRLFDESMASLRFEIDGKQLTSQEAFDLMQNKDRDVRRNAASAIDKVLQNNSKLFTLITNVLAKDKAIEDKWRSYKAPISSRNLDNFIEDEVVESLLSSVKRNYSSISHRYYKIKAKLLGLEKLEYYDRNAPLPFSDDKVYSFEEAKSLVLSGYESFSLEFATLGKKFFDNKWIDAKVVPGKSDGAFCHSTVPSVHPYIMLNYLGKTRDVTTIAHEVGHGVHQLLAAKKGYFMSQTPLTLAETASVFGEQLVFRELLKRQDNENSKIAILAGKIDDMINTVVRQTAFCEFEIRVHNLRQKKELTTDEINDIWLSVQSESLGDNISLSGGYKYYWSYIPHFIHSPFYVYAYAFGDLLVNSLYALYQKNSIPNFAEKYMNMLSLGGTKHHSEALKLLDIDIRREDFWQNGLDIITNLITQLEEIESRRKNVS